MKKVKKRIDDACKVELVSDLADPLDCYGLGFLRKTYPDGEVTYVIRRVDTLEGLFDEVELKRHEVTKLLVDAFEEMKNTDLVRKMDTLKMPTNIKQ